MKKLPIWKYLRTLGYITENHIANEDDDIFSISPNPASDILKIHFHNLKDITTNTIIEIYSFNGFLAQEITIHPQKEIDINLDISILKNGTYILKLISGNKITMKKFIVLK